MSDDLPNPPEEVKVEETTFFKPSLYKGRFTRKQYFLYLLVGGIIFRFLTFLDIIGAQWGLFLISILAAFLFFVPIAIKRAHDIGLKGSFVITSYIILFIVAFLDIGTVRLDGNSDEHFWLAFYLIILIPAIIYGSFLLFKDSDKGTNVYGPSAKYPSETLSAPLTEQSENIDKKQKLRKWEIWGNIAQLMSFFVMMSVYFFFPITLHQAVNDNNTKIAELMIKMGSDVNEVNNFSQTPLLHACWSISEIPTESVKVLIENGADVNKADEHGTTPLRMAALNGKIEICKLLIASGADVNKADEHGTIPLHEAAVSGTPPLRMAGKIEICKLLIASGADVNKANEGGTTPLHMAAVSGEIEICKLLIASGADVNKAEDGKTPLHMVAVNGEIEICKLLIASGADINKANKYGKTPLREASDEGHTEVVKLLLAAGADVNKADKRGNTPLQAASFGGHTDIVKLLKAAGAKE